MKKYLKKFAAIGIILYMAQAMVGIYYGVQAGIHIANNSAERKVDVTN